MDTQIGDQSIFANSGILTKREYEESQLVYEPGDDGLDRNAFLQLLTTQLQNQNPLDPMKNEAFVAQLAQFSQLEGITNMSTSIPRIEQVIRNDRLMSGANFVGKTVLSQSGEIYSDGQTASEIEIDLPYGAESIELKIIDQSTGLPIRTIASGAQSSGLATFNWDGRNTSGQMMSSGTYSIQGTVKINGMNEAVIPKTYSRVGSVSWNAATTELTLNLDGGVSVPLEQVTKIAQPISTLNINPQIKTEEQVDSKTTVDEGPIEVGELSNSLSK